MKRGRRIWLVLLGCGVIGLIAALIGWRDHGPDYRGRSNAILGFAPEAMGKESQPGREVSVGLPPSPGVSIVVAADGVILKDGKAWRGIGINYFSAFNRLNYHEPAIWAWELGNEYSLGADLPNAAEHRPPVQLDLGTAASRSAEDDLTHEMVVTACAEFGRAVRALDSTRPITTGHSLPRRAAEHLRREKTWAQDSPGEFERNLVEVTPSPCDLISVHLYPFDKERFNAKDTPYAQTMRYCMEAARRGGKALFVGEFGAPDSQKDGGPEAARKHILEMIAALESTGVPLAALWNFDLTGQDSSLNVAADDPRSWVLGELQHANERLQRQH